MVAKLLRMIFLQRSQIPLGDGIARMLELVCLTLAFCWNTKRITTTAFLISFLNSLVRRSMIGAKTARRAVAVHIVGTMLVPMNIRQTPLLLSIIIAVVFLSMAICFAEWICHRLIYR